MRIFLLENTGTKTIHSLTEFDLGFEKLNCQSILLLPIVEKHMFLSQDGNYVGTTFWVLKLSK